jgi:hypothetical protein
MAEPAVERKCGIEEVFASPFIELIALAPRNPVVRGLILAQTRKLPGPEVETFEQIKHWVETTCNKRLRSANASSPSTSEGITIKVEFSETEYGRANYSTRRSGTDEFALAEEELLGLVRDAIADGDGVSDVVEKIAELIEDDAWSRCNPSLDDYGDYDYDNHDSDSSDNSSTEFSKTDVRERLLVFLRERHPELLEELV